MKGRVGYLSINLQCTSGEQKVNPANLHGNDTELGSVMYIAMELSVKRWKPGGVDSRWQSRAIGW